MWINVLEKRIEGRDLRKVSGKARIQTGASGLVTQLLFDQGESFAGHPQNPPLYLEVAFAQGLNGSWFSENALEYLEHFLLFPRDLDELAGDLPNCELGHEVLLHKSVVLVVNNAVSPQRHNLHAVPHVVLAYLHVQMFLQHIGVVALALGQCPIWDLSADRVPFDLLVGTSVLFSECDELLYFGSRPSHSLHYGVDRRY